MERTLFAFIWKHSMPQQIRLLMVTVATFPLLYISLELPKIIVNDAIGGTSEQIPLWGYELTRIEYLGVLCAGFLLAVLASGLLKMQLNTMKGVVAERLLRRFRYELISRILRFPPVYFRRTSQGELISIVTGEAEPLGGVMGDALAQPVFQAGQMLTIMIFLFVQNVWLGLAAVALIPLQAWLIPYLQRRINQLQKKRVFEVRKLSESLGESIQGVEDIRANGGAPYTLASFSNRLGRLFDIRYRIYQQKFFLKFINNFITQLTPFFFFSIGGYLAIMGDLTVGALVAALAAYKDLTSPWKELLNYYNRVQEMTLRHETIVERFAPQGMIEADLFEGRPDEIPSLSGDIVFDNVSVRELDGRVLLEDFSATFPKGATVAIKTGNAVERRVMLQLLSRSFAPTSGTLPVAGHDLSKMHQVAIASRVGVVPSMPRLFNRTIGENVQMALRTSPLLSAERPDPEALRAIEEARSSGNSDDPLEAEWLNLDAAGVGSTQELRAWWLKIVETAGTDDFLFRSGLDAKFDAERNPDLTEAILKMRPAIEQRLNEAGLSKAYHRFHEKQFNPGLAIGGNLLFAAAYNEPDPIAMAADPRFLQSIREVGLEDDILDLSARLASIIVEAFGAVGADHPLYRRAGLPVELFDVIVDVARAKRLGKLQELDDATRASMMAVPFRISAEQIGETFPVPLKRKILELREARGAELRDQARDTFLGLDESKVHPGLTVLENLIFGRLSRTREGEGEQVRKIVGDALIDAGLKGAVAILILDVEAGVGGANLPPLALERIAFVRAVIKRPDVLVLDQALASHDADSRLRTRERLRTLLPEATLIFLEPNFHRPDEYDVFLEIMDGQLVRKVEAMAEPAVSKPERSDLEKKLRAIEMAELFADLPRAQQRLLAFASEWVEAAPGEVLFNSGDPTDGAYLAVKGTADLVRNDLPEEHRAISEVYPGRVVGDLSVIRGTDREVGMVARTDFVGLRIGARELLDVLRSDPGASMIMMKSIADNLIEVAGRLFDVRNELDSAIRPSDPDARKETEKV